MADTLIKTKELADTASHNMDMMSLILQADIVVQSVMVLLLLASFWCWAIIFDKIMMFRGLRYKTQKFEKIFWSGAPLSQLFDQLQAKPDHPMVKIFVAAMREWNRRQKKEPGDRQELRAGFRQRTMQAMQVSLNRSAEQMEKHLSFLATVGSAAPFIGLFGTVWGIMNSFQSIAASKNTTLVVVAPGIAEALLATAIGLFAAIPAVIFYNKFATDLKRMVGKLDDFSTEMDALLSRQSEGE